MTQENKELLLKDLCARLPYGIIVHFHDINVDDYDRQLIGEDIDFIELDRRNCKPYLRLMSSMTEEERDELYTAMDWYGETDKTGNVYTKGQEKVYRETFYEYTDWLISHHFDFRGLIEKGLAFEAPNNMYKNE